MKYAAGATVAIFLVVVLFVLNTLVPLIVDRIQDVLP